MNNTPIINREAFLNSLSRFIAEAKVDESTLGLLLIDVNNLAQINHQRSYIDGDKALIHCYEQLQSVSKLEDTVYRIGDHQFVFILPTLKNPAFIALAMNKVNKVLEGGIFNDEKNVDIDIKIGIAINKNAQFSNEETLLTAESSLKHSKANKGPFNIKPVTSKTKQTQDFEQIFSDKLKTNDFELYYQPKVDMKTGLVDRAEALLRWQIPGEGFISPEIAVELADKIGQSFTLTKWVIHTAVRQISEWKKKGITLSIAVNVQADLVQHPDLYNLVQDSLAIWGVDRAQLTLEITESAVIEDKEAGFDNLSKLKEFGVQLSIDDFGTGYSSMSYFKHIPANELKIDQSFVMKMLDNTQDQQIVKIIIEIGQLFDLKLVAEGIEDQPTYDYLKQLGCDYGQGYHMAKPMPVDVFTQYIQKQNQTE